MLYSTEKDKRKEKKKKKVAHIVSFDEDDTGSGKFSRINNSSGDSRGSFSYDTNSESSVSGLPNSNTSKVITHNSTSAIKDTGFKSINQLESVLQRTMEDSGDSAINNSKRLSIPSTAREPSINSFMSDSRQSHGSISSTDFELRYIIIKLL